VAITGRKAVWKQEFFWTVAFRLASRIRVFHIADEGLRAVVLVFIAARAKADCVAGSI
jgi:hypothetical protein